MVLRSMPLMVNVTDRRVLHLLLIIRFLLFHALAHIEFHTSFQSALLCDAPPFLVSSRSSRDVNRSPFFCTTLRHDAERQVSGAPGSGSGADAGSRRLPGKGTGYPAPSP